MPNKNNDEYLFHYTSPAGLQGILSTQSLWATHCRQLNDTTEHTHGRKILDQIMIDFFSKNKEFVMQAFPHYAEEKPDTEFVKSIAATFLTHDVITRKEYTYGLYITSFCKHDISKPEFDNGLLSMWRGYGHDGGYVIQLSKTDLQEAYRVSTKNMALTSASDDVVYAESNLHNYDKFINDYKNAIKTFLEFMINRNGPLQSGILETIAFLHMTSSPCLIKSKVFEEEKEFRYIFMPAKLPTSTKAVYKQHNEPIPKESIIRSYNRNGRLIPYIDPLQDTEVKLKIKKIIVGPHHDQQRRIDALSIFAEQRGFEIVGSNIPFIGI